MWIYIYVAPINKKRDHEFEKQQGEVYGKDWSKEGKGVMM